MQRGVAGAKIIERQLGSEAADGEQGIAGIVRQRSFRQFHLKPVRRQAGFRQRPLNCANQRGTVPKLQRRDVDRDAERSVGTSGGPACRVSAGRSQDPFAQQVDQPDLLSERNEIVWGNQAADRVAPADQRLEPG